MTTTISSRVTDSSEQLFIIALLLFLLLSRGWWGRNKWRKKACYFCLFYSTHSHTHTVSALHTVCMYVCTLSSCYCCCCCCCCCCRCGCCFLAMKCVLICCACKKLSAARWLDDNDNDGLLEWGGGGLLWGGVTAQYGVAATPTPTAKT